MGVPLVTLKGGSHFSRNTASILNTISHPELIAKDHDEYAKIAVGLGEDTEKLISYRKILRKSYLAKFKQNPSKIAKVLINTVTRKVDLIKREQDIT